MTEMWFKIINQQAELKIVVKPNAKQTKFVKINEEGMHISLHAKPHEGKANKALISFLSELFQVPKSHIVLQRGKSSRYKVISVPLTIKVQEFLNSAI